MNQDERLSELGALKGRVAALESELAAEAAEASKWVPSTYYTTYHILAGMVLDMLGAAASLLFNVIGILLIYPNKTIRRLPLRAARQLALTATRSRRLAVLLVIGLFYALPASLIFLYRLLS